MHVSSAEDSPPKLIIRDSASKWKNDYPGPVIPSHNNYLKIISNSQFHEHSNNNQNVQHYKHLTL